jgi:hypothetical protein
MILTAASALLINISILVFCAVQVSRAAVDRQACVADAAVVAVHHRACIKCVACSKRKQQLTCMPEGLLRLRW